MDLIERLDEIDENDLDSVLAFLYKEDVTKYDLQNMQDNYTLYSFWTHIGRKLGHSKIIQLTLLAGGQDKTPQIFKFGYAATLTVNHYAAMKRFTDHALSEPTLMDIYKKIISILKEKVENGYVCYMRTYPLEDVDNKKPWNNFYFSQVRDIDNNFAEVMMQLSDAIDSAGIVKISCEKAAKKGEKAALEEMSFFADGSTFTLTPLVKKGK